MSNLAKTSKGCQTISRNAADLLAVIEEIQRKVKVGQSLRKIDQLAERLIRAKGGQPAFKKVPGYDWTTCINVNEGVVHGIPDDQKLASGDLVSVDLGLWRGGWYSDMSRSWVVGKISPEKELFVEAGREILTKAIGVVKPGHNVGLISQTIEKGLRAYGYWPVRTLAGHGVGRRLHQPPIIPCYLKGQIAKTPTLEPGMVLAIEVIYTRKKTSLKTEADGWTIRTQDGSWGGLEEDMVLVTDSGAKVLTRHD